MRRPRTRRIFKGELLNVSEDKTPAEQSAIMALHDLLDRAEPKITYDRSGTHIEFPLGSLARHFTRQQIKLLYKLRYFLSEEKANL